MEGGKNQVPGFGCLKDGLGSLVVSHLDDNHVRVCAHRAANGRRVGVKVLTHLALFDRTPGRRINELDWVFDRQDVVSPVLIDMLDQAIDRRGFTAAGRPGN